MSVAPMLGAARALTEAGLDVPAMGGRLRLRVASTEDDRARAERDLELLARRVGRWAARLTRFESTSELCALNASADAAETPVGPTLAAVLAWATVAGRRTAGTVDVTLLDERRAAESGIPLALRSAKPRWETSRSTGGRGHRVMREGRVRFDLDGVAKGWIADRALRALRRYPAAMVDADGDIALSMRPGMDWSIGVADPNHAGHDLVVLGLDRIGARVLGVATSGIDVHRWGDDRDRHHLIDPRTGRPAASDVAQCTVVAESAALAEVVAKAVVIDGSVRGAASLALPGVRGAVVLRRDGDVLATEQVLPWLA